MFIIVMDTMSKLIYKFQALCLYNPAPFSYNSISVSHSLYADDCMLFAKATTAQWDNITLIFNYLYTWTGLHINPDKSSIFFSANTPVTLIEDILHYSNLTLMPSDSLYLGNPISRLKGNLTTYSYLIKKIQTKLVNWKCNLLSKAGKHLLITSTLSNIPIYFMSLCMLLMAIINHITKIIRDFWWHGNQNHNKGFKLISWDTIATLKDYGGTGIRQLLFLNKALLIKPFWELLTASSHNASI